MLRWRGVCCDTTCCILNCSLELLGPLLRLSAFFGWHLVQIPMQPSQLGPWGYVIYRIQYMIQVIVELIYVHRLTTEYTSEVFRLVQIPLQVVIAVYFIIMLKAKRYTGGYSILRPMTNLVLLHCLC